MSKVGGLYPGRVGLLALIVTVGWAVLLVVAPWVQAWLPEAYCMLAWAPWLQWLLSLVLAAVVGTLWIVSIFGMILLLVIIISAGIDAFSGPITRAASPFLQRIEAPSWWTPDVVFAGIVVVGVSSLLFLLADGVQKQYAACDEAATPIEVWCANLCSPRKNLVLDGACYCLAEEP